MKVRRHRAESGTCHAESCGELVREGAPHPVDGSKTIRAFCPRHAAERDAELLERNRRGESAEVVRIEDHEDMRRPILPAWARRKT